MASRRTTPRPAAPSASAVRPVAAGDRRVAATLLALVAAAALAGCGSEPVSGLPPAAGPDAAPVVTAAVPGRVLRLPRPATPIGVLDGRLLLRTTGAPLALGAADDTLLHPRSTPDLAAPAGASIDSTAGRVPHVDVDRRGRRVVVLTEPDGRVQVAAAGVGPTNAAVSGGWLYVADTAGDALLVFRLRPKLELERRVYLPGGPFGMAVDRVGLRLYVTLSGRNEVAELPAHGRPHVLRTFATLRQPTAVAVDPRTGRLWISGQDRRALQVLDPGPSPTTVAGQRPVRRAGYP